MPNLANSVEDPETLNGDPHELLSSLAFEPFTPAPAPPQPSISTAETVNSSVLCTGSWEMPFTASTSDESDFRSSDTLEETPSSESQQRRQVSEAGEQSSSFGRSLESDSSNIPGPPTLSSMDDSDYDDDEEEILPGAEAVTRGSATPRPPLGKTSPEAPVRLSLSGTYMFNDLQNELAEAKPVKTEEELKTQIRIDAQKRYHENAQVILAEEVDLESAEERRKQQRIRDIKGSWRCSTLLCICCILVVIIVAVVASSVNNDDDDNSQARSTIILTTENPTASPTFSEVVTPFLCDEAVPLDGNSSIVGSTKGAPTPGGVPVCSGLASNGYGAWFEFVGDGNVFNCTTCDPATNFDTQLSVFAGSCSKLQCVAANDQGRSESCDSRSKVEFSTNPGETYFIFVHGKREAEGQVVLSLNPVPQENDSCESAGPVLPSGLNEIIGNTWFAATSKTADNFTCSESTVPGLWYAMEGQDEDITISTCSETTKYDADISVATGGSCNGLTCVSTTSEDCIEPFRGTIKTFFGNAGTTYFVKIHGSEAARASALLSRRLDAGAGAGASPADGQFGMITRDDVGASGFFVDRQEACEASQEIEIDGEPTTGILYQSSNLLWDSFCEGDGQGEYLRVTGNGRNLTANTCNNDTAIDTTLAVLTGDDCSNQEMPCIASNDQFCGDQSSVTWFAKEGVTYYLLVRSVGAIQGEYAVSVSSAPSVDDDPLTTPIDIIDPVQECESARERDVLGSSNAATLLGGQAFLYEPELSGSCGTSSYNNSLAVWFKLDDTRAGTKILASAEDCYNTAPLQLTVFSGRCDELICVAGSSDFCNENVEWEWENGVSYYLMFHGPDSIGATFVFTVDSVIA
mmetsp:Transcript_31927/g.77395  ORF Transcript_31927/g.77395 Transcript_31927/m.77395 type:complete len:861 (+) Transcript_31927:111-2693(+)